MEFKEFSEYPDLEEEDFDIKSGFRGSSSTDPTPDEDINIEEDIFEDENINATLKNNNYDYRRLVMLLFTFSSDDEIAEALEACGLTRQEYYYPTAETFEILRDYCINRHKKQK